METRTSSEVNSTHRLRLPILNWLPGYQGGWLRFDILAGVTAAAVVIPQAMAYATIAGLPVQVGLYTALVPMLIYALLGTSKPLSVSTTSTIAILTASELATVAAGGSPADILVTASVLALLVGVFLLLASLLRLGFIAALPHLSAPLVAVAAGIAASALFNLGAAGVSLVGEIPSGLPALRLPDLALTSQLGLGALGIALMAFVESIASARAFAEHKDPPADPDRELLALGAANLGGSLFQAMPAGGGTSQTAVNNQAGARSQLAELVSAGFVALTLLFLAPLISLMPQASLGALVMVAALGLVKVGEFRAILRIRWVEFWWAIIALFGVLVLGTLDGIMIAVAASLLALIHEANHPPLYMLGRKTGTDIFRPYHESSGDELFPGLLILRTEGRMTFASAPRLRDKILDLIHSSEPEILALDLSAVPNIEYTALQMLISFEEKLRGAGITLWLVALNPEALKVIQRSVLMKTLGTERMFFNAEQAVEAFQSRSKAADGN
ncbi:MAG: SulP family inorganic anion transporter [Anaerolineales bacterium]